MHTGWGEGTSSPPRDIIKEDYATQFSLRWSLRADLKVHLSLHSRIAIRWSRACSSFVPLSLLHGSLASLSPAPLTSESIWQWPTYKTSWGDFAITLIKKKKKIRGTQENLPLFPCQTMARVLPGFQSEDVTGKTQSYYLSTNLNAVVSKGGSRG